MKPKFTERLRDLALILAEKGNGARALLDTCPLAAGAILEAATIIDVLEARLTPGPLSDEEYIAAHRLYLQSFVHALQGHILADVHTATHAGLIAVAMGASDGSCALRSPDEHQPRNLCSFSRTLDLAAKK